MKWSSYSNANNLKAISDIEATDFENILTKQSQILSNHVKNIQEVNLPYPSLETYYKSKDKNFKYKFDKWEHLLDWYNLCYCPVINMELFRLTRFKYLDQILKKIIYFYNNNFFIELAFNLRHFLEVSAIFDFNILKMQKLSEPISNFKRPDPNLPLEIRKLLVDDFLNYKGEFIKNNLTPLFDEVWKINLPTRINLSDNEGEFIDNESLEPTEGEHGFNLKSSSILKYLKTFEKKIKNSHPTYDLLSEFLHPNSYILLGNIDDPKSEQFFFHANVKSSDNQKETIIEFIVRSKVHNLIEKVVEVIIADDQIFVAEIDNYRVSIKEIVNKTLGLLPFADFLSSSKNFNNYKCLCGSDKLLRFCCAKTSDKDKKLLTQHVTKLKMKKFNITH